MSDRYKLVFRGEVLDGQHPAVVRKRLASAASFQEAQLDKLFSGQPVIVKREADTATAARLQVLFKNAGARLRVLPVDGAEAAASPVAGAAEKPDPGASAGAPAAAEPTAPAGPSGSAGYELLPAGSDLLRQNERTAFVPREVDTGSLSLEGARFTIPEAAPDAAGPDVSHLTLAAPGSDLAEPSEVPPPAPVPEFGIAEAGVDLGQLRVAVEVPLDLDQLDFEVAPAGADLAPARRTEPPPPPDTSRLSLIADTADHSAARSDES